MVAGEASGDLLGGELLSTLKVRFPQLVAFGVGGSRMRANGLSGKFDINDLSVVGLVEVLKCFPRLIQVFSHLTHMLETEHPRLLVTIDLPDFNFLLAKRAKALGIPVVHYVGPQVWAWRSGRITRITRLLDHLMVLFPFEPAIYAQTSLPVTFVGHPLVNLLTPDNNQPTGDESQTSTPHSLDRHSLEVTQGEKLVVLLPGSRHGELRQLLKPMVVTCQKIAEQMPNVHFAIALADTLSAAEVTAHWPTATTAQKKLLPTISIHHGKTHALLAAADAALVASGTATLEAALIGTPMVVVYRVNRLTYEIGRRLIQVPFISLANLVAEYGLVTERIQEEVRPDLLAQDLIKLLTDTTEVAKMQTGFAKIREKLSNPARQAADVIADFM